MYKLMTYKNNDSLLMFCATLVHFFSKTKFLYGNKATGF